MQMHTQRGVSDGRAGTLHMHNADYNQTQGLSWIGSILEYSIWMAIKVFSVQIWTQKSANCIPSWDALCGSFEYFELKLIPKQENK